MASVARPAHLEEPMKRRKFSRRHPWRVVCPDGHLRAFPQYSKGAASDIAFEKTVAGCRPFSDDPKRWWTRRCPQGTHLTQRSRRR